MINFEFAGLQPNLQIVLQKEGISSKQWSSQGEGGSWVFKPLQKFFDQLVLCLTQVDLMIDVPYSKISSQITYLYHFPNLLNSIERTFPDRLHIIRA